MSSRTFKKATSFFFLIFFTNFLFSSQCESLNDFHSSNLIISQASISSLEANLPIFCKITGEIKPNIGFEARFPTQWNGKFFQTGCGGFCGLVEPDRSTQSNAINHALKKGYATITTNGGHQGKHLGDAAWAKNNLEAEEVYAHKLIPLTHRSGHELIQVFYDAQPTFSYFSGCSNGGRLAAKAAQEYPDLFDGIIAGCPILNLTKNGGIFGSWLVQANTNEQGFPILNKAFQSKLIMLEENAITQCDHWDGKLDGIIQAPQKCNITLEDIPNCLQGSNSTCLTSQEKNALRKIYDGPVDSKNNKLFYGINPGSERYLAHWYLDSDDTKGPGTLLANGFLPNLGLPEDDEAFLALSFNFDSDPELLVPQSSLLDAMKPDLSKFKNLGGKLLMWHGLADPLVLPQQSIKYYHEVIKTMGKKNVADFFKLYLVPGMGHCWEIPSALPDQMSMLTVLENWVEKNETPDSVPINKFDSLGLSTKKGILKPYPKLASYN